MSEQSEYLALIQLEIEVIYRFNATVRVLLRQVLYIHYGVHAGGYCFVVSIALDCAGVGYQGGRLVWRYIIITYSSSLTISLEGVGN